MTGSPSKHSNSPKTLADDRALVMAIVLGKYRAEKARRLGPLTAKRIVEHREP
jgi:hypothetical protein